MNKHFPEKARRILSSKGKDIIQEIGIEIIKSVVYDVLTGKNLRDSTELLTRKRITDLNTATLVSLIRGKMHDSNFIKNLPIEAAEKLLAGKLKKDERWMLQWVLGLTDKAFQNVLRDDKAGIKKYSDSYIDITKKSIKEFNTTYGELGGEISLSEDEKVTIDWYFIIQLMNIIGSQTLAIRGSDKSTFGKLFEKLILGTLLSILDFKMVDQKTNTETSNVFWLSSRDAKRESDATLLYKPGRGVRFDIGFIGRGNSEISLDKVSRFERELEMGGQKMLMNTIIIIDRIGKGSKIESLAEKINGTIIQMSGAYWPLKVAHTLKEAYGYENPILKIPQNKINEHIKMKLDSINLESILDFSAFNTDLKTIE